MVARRDERITQLALGSANRGGRLKAGDDAPQFVETISIDAIDPDPNQPRRHFDEQKLHELAASIKTSGQIQPIVVMRAGDRYLLHVGERRWRASKLAGFATIRALVRASPLPAHESLIAKVVENEQRADLTTSELVNAVQELVSLGLKNAEIAEALAKSPSRISELQALAAAPSALREIADAIGLSLSYQLLRQWRVTPVETLDFIANVPVEHISRFTIGTIGQPPPVAARASHATDRGGGEADRGTSSGEEDRTCPAGPEPSALDGPAHPLQASDRSRPAGDVGYDGPPAVASRRKESVARETLPTSGSIVVEHPRYGLGHVIFGEAVPADHLAVAFQDHEPIVAHKDEIRISRTVAAVAEHRQ